MDQECDNQNLKMGIIMESTYLETGKNHYLACQKYIEDKYKINATYEELWAEDMLKWKETEELPRQIDVFMLAITMNTLGCRIGDNYKAFSFPVRLSKLLILSKPPTPQTASTMNFFSVDFYTAFFILLCLIFVSAFWSISKHLHISLKSSNSTSSKTSILKTTLENLWNSFVLFFFEPYTFIPKTLSIRIITGVWLLGVLILSISLGSVMSSSFSFVTYNRVDTLKDLRNTKRVLIKIVKESLEERLINLKSEDNEEFRFVRNHFSEDTYLALGELASPDFYTDLKENEYFFISYKYLSQILGFLFEGEKNLGNSFYVSQPISEDYMVYAYSFNSSRCHKINTIFEQVIIDQFETQWLKYVYLRDNHLFEKMKWRIPDSETKPIQFHDLLSVYLLFSYGISLSFLVITIELLSSAIKKQKSTLKRKRNMNILD